MKTMQESSSDFIFLVCFLELEWEFRMLGEKLKNIKMLTIVLSFVTYFLLIFVHLTADLACSCLCLLSLITCVKILSVILQYSLYYTMHALIIS